MPVPCHGRIFILMEPIVIKRWQLKTRVDNKKIASVTEVPVYMSTIGIDADFLHLNLPIVGCSGKQLMMQALQNWMQILTRTQDPVGFLYSLKLI